MANAMAQLKAKDIFKIVDVHEKVKHFLQTTIQGSELPRDVQSIDNVLRKWIIQSYS